MTLQLKARMSSAVLATIIITVSGCSAGSDEPPTAPGETVAWDEADLRTDPNTIRGAAAYLAEVEKLGYHAYGLDYDRSVPPSAIIPRGRGYCAMLQEAGYDATIDAALDSPAGAFLTKDYTLEMFEAQLRSAAVTLCPEFADQLP